jgi:NAD(P)-dependent dehydrogenase (short-subunit alcohol dehydrogenase family)
MGDWNESAAAIAEKHPERTLYRRCDVSSWDDVLELFFEGWKRFGVIHSVLSNAGINSHEGLFQDSIDEKSGKLLPPNLKSIEVNLLGQIYVAKCALHFFRKWPDTPCQLAMTSSAGAYFAAPPIHLYCAAKAGVLGLMRAMYPEVAKTNVTVNVVAPWLTGNPHFKELN